MLDTTDPVPVVPRFCPRCTRAVQTDEDELCPECGERAALQGYCGVCRDFWRLAVGTDCPKHEIPLEEPPPPDFSPFGPGEAPVWETVGRYHHPSAAEAPRIRLEAEGIPTFLEGERMAGHALHHPASGGVKLQVPGSLADEARVILAQSWSPLVTDDDLDDDWDDLAATPGALRREVMRGAIVLILVLPLIHALLQWLDR